MSAEPRQVIAAISRLSPTGDPIVARTQAAAPQNMFPRSDRVRSDRTNPYFGSPLSCPIALSWLPNPTEVRR
ncbi:hypothetical protein [Chamaesiphon minutus]|uniref:hypothetical protein n=1 Tax=Chamaesiphon minutus TaxID=1173032 RepID=UPI0012F8990A|nr:hypothetical protein [Chamaesiphon minutus]